METKEDIEYSFSELEPVINRNTGNINPLFYLAGSVVILTAGSIAVYTLGLDFNPHPPIYQPHQQHIIRASSCGGKPKKIKSKIMESINHTPLTL